MLVPLRNTSRTVGPLTFAGAPRGSGQWLEDTSSWDTRSYCQLLSYQGASPRGTLLTAGEKGQRPLATHTPILSRLLPHTGAFYLGDF